MGPAAVRMDGWLVAITGCGLIVLLMLNVTLAQGLGVRCQECYLVPTWLAVYTLQRGGPYGDLSQDILGARRMIAGRDAYPIYGPALVEIGMPPQAIPHASAHPPTAFLFGLPFIHQPWPEAARQWALWVLGAIVVSWRAAGLGWPAAFALTAWGLAWPPLATSVGQLTPVWLLGQALGWRWRHTPWLAGAALGVASLTKFLPALLLAPFVLRRQWVALAGFVAVWLAAIGAILWLAPGVLQEYARVGVPTGAEQAMRPDNGALLAVATTRIRGPAPTILVVVMLAAMLLRAIRVTLAKRGADRHAWGLWAWLAVACLPVVWQPSLLPLATELVLVIVSGCLLPRVLAGAAILAPIALPWDGHVGRNGEGVFLCLVLAGMALMTHHGVDDQSDRVGPIA
jgi:hypothetical protein